METGKGKHVPVLLNEVLSVVQPHSNQIIVDCTFGAGGYAKAFLDAGAHVIAFDRDPHAIAAGHALVKEAQGRLRLVHAPFSEMEDRLRELDVEQVDAIVMDLGVSSMQFDQPERGFSFRHDGPLDMRMSGAGRGAADLVNALDEEELANILYRYGEERRSRAIARAIVKRREESPFTTTRDLADLIEKILGRKPGDKIHPATRSFQALRIAVNDELGELEKALAASRHLLKPGGVLAVVTFQSLEDRIVKQFLSARRPSSRHAPPQELTKAEWKAFKPVTPSAEEIAWNPRARSARLRAAVRL